MRKLSFTTLILLFSVFILWNSCKKEKTPTRVLGLQPTPASELSSVSFAAPKEYSGTLPTQKFLETPPPEEKGQGGEGSCVGWALAYGLKSYQYHKSCNTNYGDNLDYTTICSPEFLYNLAKVGDCSGGTYFKNAFEVLKNDGVCLWSELKYDDTDCNSSKITSDLRQKAIKHKIKSYELVSNFTTTNLKKLILNGYPIVIGVKVDEKFMALGKSSIWQAPFGTLYGYHALLIDGYDDNKGAFRILNSWGQSWGDGGYTWLKYDYFSTVVFEAYISESAESCESPIPDDKLVNCGTFTLGAKNSTYGDFLSISQCKLFNSTYAELNSPYIDLIYHNHPLHGYILYAPSTNDMQYYILSTLKLENFHTMNETYFYKANISSTDFNNATKTLLNSLVTNTDIHTTNTLYTNDFYAFRLSNGIRGIFRVISQLVGDEGYITIEVKKEN